MADEKKPVKDLTGIMEYSKEMEKQGKAMPVPEGSVMEEIKIDKIDDFESLETYSKTNPAAEPPPDEDMPVMDAHGTPPPEPAAAAATPPAENPPADPAFAVSENPPESTDFPVGGGEAAPEGTNEFPTTDSSPPANEYGGGSDSSQGEFPTTPEGAPSDQGLQGNMGSEFSNAVTGAMADNPLAMDGLADALPGGAPPPPSQLGGVTHTDVAAGSSDAMADATVISDGYSNATSPPDAGSDAGSGSASGDGLSIATPPAAAPPPSRSAASAPSVPSPDDGLSQSISSPPPAAAPTGPPPTAMQKLKSYSEKLSLGKPAVAASFPFSLLISGKLAPEEREKLLDVISRENMGFREVDLEPQFESDRVLIPRISEYAGVILVQALRGCRAQIKFGPSDQIFATAETRATEEEVTTGADDQATVFSSSVEHPAERLPLTSERTLPALPQFVVVDTVTASASLKTQIVEAESSSEYQEILEALQRELKYKAYRKGATAVLNFSISLTSLSMPTLYRITTMGSAVRAPVASDAIGMANAAAAAAAMSTSANTSAADAILAADAASRNLAPSPSTPVAPPVYTPPPALEKTAPLTPADRTQPSMDLSVAPPAEGATPSPLALALTPPGGRPPDGTPPPDSSPESGQT